MNTVLIIYILCWLVFIIIYLMKFRECNVLKKKSHYNYEEYNKLVTIITNDKLSAEEKISELKFEINNVPF